jgi:hypothetical protein
MFPILFKLPDLDSNQDKQNQNLSYYHYTIGQYPLFRDCKNKRSINPGQMDFKVLKNYAQANSSR